MRGDRSHCAQEPSPSTGQDERSWEALTRRSVALCLRDPTRWAACMDHADELEAQGVDGQAALRRALDETGA